MPNAFDAAQAQLSSGVQTLNGLDPSSTLSQIGGSLDPSELPDLQDSISAGLAIKSDGAKGIDARTQLYQAMKNSNDSLNKKRADLLTKMSEDHPLSKSETAAMLFIGLLPSLVGKAIGGNRGGQAGAQAGALGTQVMAKGFKEDEDKKDLQNQLQLSSVDKQIAKNQDLESKAKLQEITAADTAEQKNADRQQSAINAEIRAGGEISAAKETSRALSDQTKVLRNNALEAKEAARGKPITFGGKVYHTSGSVADGDVKEIRDIQNSYTDLIANVERMKAITKNGDATFFTNQFGDSASELRIAHAAALSDLQRIEEVPGRGGQYQLDNLKKMLVDPTTLYNNLTSRTPAKASLDTQLSQVKAVVSNKFEKLLKARGYDDVIPLGQQKQDPKTGKIGYYIGTGSDGQRHYTTSIEKLQDILDSQE